MTFTQQDRSENENKKFLDDGSGNPAVRVKVVKTVMSEGSVREWFDHRGFLIMRLDEATGNLAIKGSYEKI